MSLYLDERFPMESPKTVNLPSDLMVTPIQGERGTTICHSDSAGKWYVIHNFDCPLSVDGETVYAGYFFSGTWLDVARLYLSPYWADVPFHWGETHKNSRYPDRVHYIPIWQSVPTGKYHNDEACSPVMRQDYKIIVIMPYCSAIPADNPVQYNWDTRCEVKEYGENLLQLVEDLQLFTGIKF